MNRYLLNRLSAIFWIVLIFSLFAKKAAADEFPVDFNDIGGFMSPAAVIPTMPGFVN
ncbi:MAG: hypothetical protein M0R33_09390 [Methylomonas sp.]|jgi:hypothetical protein|uniref:hypothetical protein n=1 Tax=Methylomonas sp. TaxID=418 RepID=UPI0025DAD246|nr:hypothetical protein [Methylomonas sp.]MCK9606649.1 hypothetical protein [Methylomonas sp.]